MCLSLASSFCFFLNLGHLTGCVTQGHKDVDWNLYIWKISLPLTAISNVTHSLWITCLTLSGSLLRLAFTTATWSLLPWTLSNLCPPGLQFGRQQAFLFLFLYLCLSLSLWLYVSLYCLLSLWWKSHQSIEGFPLEIPDLLVLSFSFLFVFCLHYT